VSAPAGWLEAAAAAHPERQALIGSDGSLSYGTLQARARALASRLCQSGVAHGGVLAVASADPWLIALLLHAAPLAGCALAPLNPDLPAPHLAALLRDCRATHVVASPGLASLPPSLRTLTPDWVLAKRPVDDSADLRPLEPEEVQLIVATSGSSDAPRGVMLTAANLAAAVQASSLRLPLTPEDLWLVCLPLFHIGGLAILLRCLQAGAGAMLLPRFDPSAVQKAIATRRATHVSLVATMLARLLEDGRGWRPPATLRCALLGGGPLPADLARRALQAGWPLWVSYGMTETGSQAATLGPITPEWVAGQVGKPLSHVELRVVPRPGPGRICLRGPGVMLGYANAAGVRGVGLSEGWLQTADVGTLSPDGTLRVHGRADWVVVTGGAKVSPAQVEALLTVCPRVGEVGVTSVADPEWGERLVAVVTGPADLTELDRWCRNHLPGHMRPRRLLRATALPRTPLGKLERAALAALALRLIIPADKQE